VQELNQSIAQGAELRGDSSVRLPLGSLFQQLSHSLQLPFHPQGRYTELIEAVPVVVDFLLGKLLRRLNL
jgi:hypothetical protein